MVGNHSAPVPAVLVENIDTLFEMSDQAPGAFLIMLDHMNFVCPCGCGALVSLPLRIPSDTVTHPSWEWNQDTVKPTLQPSIRRVEGCLYHGYLTDGIWTFCSDSGCHA